MWDMWDRFTLSQVDQAGAASSQPELSQDPVMAVDGHVDPKKQMALCFIAGLYADIMLGGFG